MDEPLGALDAEFRAVMRAEIKRLHLAQNATTVYVTHDQIEAMAMGDRIVVMSNAVVQQVGTPAQVYYDPANLFVARFIGSPGMNLLSGRVRGGRHECARRQPLSCARRVARRAGGESHVARGGAGLPARSRRGRCGRTARAGRYTPRTCRERISMLHVALQPEDPDSVVHIRADRDHLLPMGSTIAFGVDERYVRFFDPASERALPLPDADRRSGRRPMADVRVESITKKFRSITALDDVSFEVLDGEFFVLLGPTGAGKTTTLRVIAGLGGAGRRVRSTSTACPLATSRRRAAM